MNFHSLESIVRATKTPFPMRAASDSFFLASARQQPYIEPTFEKVEFDTERPQVILVSAVGATGKTALAQVLAHRTGLPLLDLAKHKPVGDNTLTGLLTGGFRVEDLSGIFQGLRNASFGVIIDGVDEARSKTTEKAFEAFLDDVIRLCAEAPGTSFVLLGRTQILEECWLYLAEKGTTVGLLTISPFDMDHARTYIDSFTGAAATSARNEYFDVRDEILAKLGAAFAHSTEDADRNFLSFIGYPPVLDAIVALLSEEKNYYRLKGELNADDLNNVEIGLIHRIISYILKRERDQKVIPNIVKPLLAGLPEPQQHEVSMRIFDFEEQAFRILSHCVGHQARLAVIPEPVLNEQYEGQLAGWVVEHPFLVGRDFRSAVFEAATLATLIASHREEYVRLALSYVETHKNNYHLIYLLHHIVGDKLVPLSCTQAILGSAMEFRSTITSVELQVDGPPFDPFDEQPTQGLIEIQIDVITGPTRESTKTFLFRSGLDGSAVLHLGPRLTQAFVSVPCDVSFSGAAELEMVAPVEVNAKGLRLQAASLVLRGSASQTVNKHVLLEGESLESSLTSIVTNGVDLTIAVSDRAGIVYPAIQFVHDREVLVSDPSLKEKFLRLKRILVHFRSHSKGALAKYRHKIEHVRVLGTESGPAILDRLLTDGILTRDGSFYFVEPENFHLHLGVSWDALRKGQSSEKLLQYLRAIG